jgi:hypothetical protein
MMAHGGPKHVAAIDGLNINNINKIGAFVGLFYTSRTVI